MLVHAALILTIAQPSAGQLARAIERLGVVGNVLYVAAHPDDENTRLLAWLANEKLVRAAYLSVTRGDGGQNLLGPEQGPLLGLIRTQELLAARRIDGAQQLFTRARDFGYSKSPDETLKIWGRDEVLGDFVRIIRRFRPDIIVSRFPTRGVDTHGQHTASAMLAEAAFRAAADPKVQTGDPPWQARRLLLNKPNFFSKDVTGQIKVDVGTYNPLLGLSYGEMAAQSRSMHKSQGFGAAPTRGHSYEWFDVLAGDAAKGLFDGIDLSWNRVPGSAKLAQLLQRARAEFRADRPDAILPVLLEAWDAMGAMPDNPWKQPKQQELLDVITGCAGLFLEASAKQHEVAPGGTASATLLAVNRSDARIRLEEIRLPGGKVDVGKPLSHDEPVAIEHAIAVARDAAWSNPYWLSNKPEAGLFTVSDARLIGQPEGAPPLSAEFVVSIAGHRLTLARPLIYKWTDPVAGERQRTVVIVPPVTMQPQRPVLMFPDARPRALRAILKAAAPGVQGTIRAELPAGWRAEPPSITFKLGAPGDEQEVAFNIHPGAGTGSARLSAEVDGRKLDRGRITIDYPHIPIQTLLPEAEVKLVRFDLKKTRARIGYINGAGDEVAEALRQVGYDVTPLSDEALAGEPLGRFEAIVVGVRAFNTNKRLPFLHKKLMDYVAGGGTLVVQYNTSNFIAKAPPDIGPYPFEIGHDRVTDETAAVTMDAHPILRSPNKITAADFDGWIQERGLYYAGKWDSHYETPLAMNDPGEKPTRGSLLVARHGKGVFIYTGLAFFRQLPAGVPGAYRLLANLIGHGR